MAQWIYFFHSLWEALGLKNFFFSNFIQLFITRAEVDGTPSQIPAF